ncbi:MAG: hypothetical protein GWN67_20820, partial [Phycisphaerae bacterium]|nr:hypothetical protein [Phycisphaerae bacterium]NIP54564.1 hypothetical protein [Phycisphaerae bacterium]NIS53406.1 hypothetical protein [Phycisphaerae bacterium]NIU10897.1 hypothetical protein [Phycisphaerae bacterium]NIU58734.1 hypothetical protein [Phycisphaerae bacterium]
MNAKLILFWNRVRDLMFRTKYVPLFSIILLLTGLICFCSVQAMAQSEPPDEEITDPPRFIIELVRNTELKRRQVERMRNSGAGWGNIMIATRLAERIAADSEGLMTFDEALADVFRARVEGKGFGQIANENDLKLGRVLSDKDDTPLRRDPEGEDDTPDSTNPPPFIVELVRKTELNRNQV